MKCIKDGTPVEEYLKHFQKTMSKELVVYVDNDALLFSRYLFIEKVGSKRFATCSHCHAKFLFGKAKQNSDTVCPVCQSKCRVKHLGIPRKNLIDRAYFVVFEKSVCDPNTIVARGLQVVRDYSDAFNYMNVETKFYEEALYVFSVSSVEASV